MIRPFLIALQFLTRLPVRLHRAPDSGEVGRSLPFYPLVGLILGALLAALAWLLAALPPHLAAALLLVAWVALTGALHLDGLADTCDAWAGGRGDPEHTLAIMKDPRSGPMGVTAVVLVLLTKFAALAALMETAEPTALVSAPLLGRLMLPLLFLTTDYVRHAGIGTALAGHAPRGMLVLVLFTGLVSIVLAGGATGSGMVLACLVQYYAIRAALIRRIGGTTGDTAGALVELTETVALVAAILAHPAFA